MSPPLPEPTTTIITTTITTPTPLKEPTCSYLDHMGLSWMKRYIVVMMYEVYISLLCVDVVTNGFYVFLF